MSIVSTTCATTATRSAKRLLNFRSPRPVRNVSTSKGVFDRTPRARGVRLLSLTTCSQCRDASRTPACENRSFGTIDAVLNADVQCGEINRRCQMLLAEAADTREVRKTPFRGSSRPRSVEAEVVDRHASWCERGGEAFRIGSFLRRSHRWIRGGVWCFTVDATSWRVLCLRPCKL